MSEAPKGVTDRLVTAILERDYATVRELGSFLLVVEKLQGGWLKRYSDAELSDWAREHGHRDPADVLEAIDARALDTDMPPGPMSIKKYLHQQDVVASGDRTTRSPWRRPDVLALVRQLLAEGKTACSCGHHSNWHRLSYSKHAPGYHVAICPTCGGIEFGQAVEARSLPDVIASAA